MALMKAGVAAQEALRRSSTAANPPLYLVGI
jgi:hypothetical protein